MNERAAPTIYPLRSVRSDGYRLDPFVPWSFFRLLQPFITAYHGKVDGWAQRFAFLFLSLFSEDQAMATEVQAHITGTVWKIEVKEGDVVREGDTVVILESMKMEMPVEAPVAGTVREIKVKEGAAVEEGAVLLVIE